MQDFLPLTDEQRDMQRLARDFATTEIAPYAAQWDREQRFESGLVRRLGELGFLGMLLPEAYGGLALPTVTYLLVLEEIAAADASVAVLMSVHSLPSQMVLARGTDAGAGASNRWPPARCSGLRLCRSPTPVPTPQPADPGRPRRRRLRAQWHEIVE
jgi:alkylation response protein AidB-like acyl-CoA dehydrogenase